ncbi:MAG TPA: DUF3147 family protein [Candidatus Udaeobacter sp.]|nr:DUF3147 family protein [Candidatus Udaeobacter sp.]
MSQSGRPQLEPSAIAQHGVKDYLVRFAFGAGIALVAGLIGMGFGPKVGGIFLGFPAILPASLTLIEKRHGRDQAAIDSEGAILGAAGFVAYAAIVAVVVTQWGVVTTLMVALVAWAVVAVALYALVRAIFHREPSPP